MTILALYTDETKWTKNAWCRFMNYRGFDVDGERSDIYKSNTFCWCLDAAIRKCYPATGTQDKTRKIIAGAIRKVPAWSFYNHIDDMTTIIGWNDAPERTFKDVVELLKPLGV